MMKLVLIFTLLYVNLPNKLYGSIFTYSNSFIFYNYKQDIDTTDLIIDLQNEQISLQEKILALEKENQKLNANSQMVAEKNENLIIQLEEFQKKILELQEENSALSDIAKESENTLGKVNNDLMTRDIALSQLNNEKKLLQAENTLLNTEFSELKAEKLRLIGEKDKALEENAKLIESNNLREKQFTNKNETILQYQTHENKLNADITSLQNKIEDFNQVLESKTKEIENNTENNLNLTNQIQALQAILAKAAINLEELQKQLSQINSEFSTLSQDYKNKQSEVDQLTHINLANKNLIESLEKKNTINLSEKAEIHQLVNEMQDEIGLLKLELKNYEKIISAYKTSNN